MQYILAAPVGQPFKFRETIILGKFSDPTYSYWPPPPISRTFVIFIADLIYLTSNDGTFWVLESSVALP